MSNKPPRTQPARRRPGTRVSNARASSSGTARWWIVAGVAVVVVGALAVALIADNRSDVSTTGVASAGFDTGASAADDLVHGRVQVTGTPLPEMPETAQTGGPAPADPAHGRQVPAVAGQRFDGQPITISASGKPKVVVVLAHWCPHCQKEVPLLVDHLGGQLPADVDLYAVASGTVESRPNFPPGEWLRRESWPVPTLVDDDQGTAASAYGLSGYPFFVAVDAAGTVTARRSGEITMAELDALLTAARGG